MVGSSVRKLLESDLPISSVDSLLLHAATHSATWFNQHLKSTLAATRLVELASDIVHLDLKILALLSCFPDFITDHNRLRIILESALAQLADDGTPPCPADIHAISRLFESFLLNTPPWLQSIKKANEDQWKELMGQMNRVISDLREGENNARAVSRQNGRGLVLAKRKDIKDAPVSQEGRGKNEESLDKWKGLSMLRGFVGGRSNENAANRPRLLAFEENGSYDDRQYSCSATWDI